MIEFREPPRVPDYFFLTYCTVEHSCQIFILQVSAGSGRPKPCIRLGAMPVISEKI